MKSKVALVTGGTGGIGGEICKALIKEGYQVIAGYYSGGQHEKAQKWQVEMREQGYDIALAYGNIRNWESCQECIEKINREFGSIDVLVNNAGITKDNLLMRISETDFDKVIEVNLKSVFNLTKAVIRPMMKQRSGSIINMSSVVGLKGNAGQANYAASKAGILGFSKSVALELGSRNIRSNVVAPGFIETEMTAKLDEKVVEGWRNEIPLKRGGSPKDIANACVFLASDMSSYITGQTLSVDGGMLT